MACEATESAPLPPCPPTPPPFSFSSLSSFLFSFLLNTCVDPPHEQKITSLAFQPKRSAAVNVTNTSPMATNRRHSSSAPPHMAVSTSLDGKFRMWVVVDSNVGKREEEGNLPSWSWACRSVGYYRNLPCLGAAFCEDGSLMALNFQKVKWTPLCRHQ